LAHWGDFGRMAVVTDVDWTANAVRLFAPLFIIRYAPSPPPNSMRRGAGYCNPAPKLRGSGGVKAALVKN